MSPTSAPDTHPAVAFAAVVGGVASFVLAEGSAPCSPGAGLACGPTDRKDDDGFFSTSHERVAGGTATRRDR